jgi:hypothetical protein
MTRGNGGKPEKDSLMSDRVIPETAREGPPGVRDTGPDSAERVFFHDAEMTEMALLLAGRQAAALERMAHQRGLTVGQLLRRLIRDCLAGEDCPPGCFAVVREEDNRRPRGRLDLPSRTSERSES